MCSFIYFSLYYAYCLCTSSSQAIEELRRELEHYHPISQQKRTTIASLLLFLLVVTSVSSVFTVAADRELQSTIHDAWATDREVKKAHVLFSMCLLFLFFCVTLTMGVAILWFILETYFYIHRRRMLNQATARMVREARRRSSLLATTTL